MAAERSIVQRDDESRGQSVVSSRFYLPPSAAGAAPWGIWRLPKASRCGHSRSLTRLPRASARDAPWSLLRFICAASTPRDMFASGGARLAALVGSPSSPSLAPVLGSARSAAFRSTRAPTLTPGSRRGPPRRGTRLRPSQPLRLGNPEFTRRVNGRRGAFRGAKNSARADPSPRPRRASPP